MSSFTHTWLVSSSVTGFSRKVKNNLPRVIFHNGTWGGGGRGAVQSIAGCWNWTWHLLEAEAIKENYRDGNLGRSLLWSVSGGKKTKVGVGKGGERRWSRNKTYFNLLLFSCYDSADAWPETASPAALDYFYIHANGGVQPDPFMNTAAVPAMHMHEHRRKSLNHFYLRRQSMFQYNAICGGCNLHTSVASATCNELLKGERRTVSEFLTTPCRDSISQQRFPKSVPSRPAGKISLGRPLEIFWSHLYVWPRNTSCFMISVCH